MNEYKEVDWFAEMMKSKLRQNENKGGWNNCIVHYLIMRLEDEVHELKNVALASEYDSQEVIDEAADVANFAMMIADRFR